MGDSLIKVVLPCPNETDETWETFKPFIERFRAGLIQFPPGVDYDLIPVLFRPDLTGEVSDLFAGLPVDQFELYRGGGCDIGAAQWVAEGCDDEDFIVAMTSRVYFHRAGWLKHLWQARQLYGPGLYGCFASKEGGRLHIGTRAYSMDAGIWKEYPVTIHSRDQGTFFEVGMDNPHGNLMEWSISRRFGAYVVYWDGVRRWEHCQKPDNIFRKGNQENLLVWDKHTDAFFKADLEEKQRLHDVCFGLESETLKA